MSELSPSRAAVAVAIVLAAAAAAAAIAGGGGVRGRQWPCGSLGSLCLVDVVG
ncbi:hypothetical protein ACIG0C_36175 [Kitasatospora aureofaciens]|uniref:hypothetical protein n=1 Tax=Kitasatospora aureofaciens TaxID=1894 RepID=UPI000AEC11D2|nr:hypothetical protein [Kitasatospora aureofaciens]